MEALAEIGRGVRLSWRGQFWNMDGKFVWSKFPARGAGWYPRARCCSFRERLCPAVTGDLPPPWSKKIAAGFLGRPRFFQIRFFSAGQGKSSSFVADVRGDLACDGRQTWYRIRGRVTGKKSSVEVDEPEVVHGDDPRRAAPRATLDVLHEVLSSGEHQALHEQALEDLHKLGPKARPVAARLLRNKDADTRRLGALVMWGAPGSDLPLLAALLRDPDRKLRNEMIHEFATRGKRHPRMLTHLAMLLREKNADVVLLTARALCLTTGSQGMLHVVAALDHEDAKVREALAKLVGNAAQDMNVADASLGAASWPVAAVKALARLLRDREVKVRLAAVRALVLFKERSIDPLALALKDSSEQVRNHAVFHLGRLGKKAARALPALRAHLKTTGKKGFDRTLAAEAVRKVQGKMDLFSGVTLAASTGVAECDEYLRKYKQCIRTSIPAAYKPAMNKALEFTRNSWLRTARDPARHKMLAEACRRAAEATRKALASFNCKW